MAREPAARGAARSVPYPGAVDPADDPEPTEVVGSPDPVDEWDELDAEEWAELEELGEPDALDEEGDDPGSSGPGGSDLRRLRAKRGLGAAVLAGAMFGIRDVLDPPKEPVSITVEASGEPGDIDADGISVPFEGGSAVAPALPVVPVRPARKAKPRKRR